MRIVLISTPIGFLGSGKGGGVELTLNSLVSGLISLGHSVEVGITTYNDHLGNLRIKSEVLVAGSSITGDSSDDTTFPDTAS